MILLLLLTVLALPAWAAVDVTALEPAVVWIKADANSTPGAGCVIKVEGERAYVLTAYHVIRPAWEGTPRRYEVDVRFKDQAGPPLRGQLKEEWLSPSIDLAVLVVGASQAQTVIPLGSALGLPKGQEVTAIGHPAYSSWAVTYGRVSNLEGLHIVFSGNAVDTGNSGGPLLDAEGQMAGLVLGERGGGERGGLGMAIRADVVRLIVAPWIGDLPSTTVAAAPPVAPAAQPPAPAPPAPSARPTPPAPQPSTPAIPAPAAAPKPAELPPMLRAKDGKEMALIPAGEFWMGCNEKVDKSCDANEKPGRGLSLDAFYIDRYEVTVAEYRKCVESGECSPAGTTDRECSWGNWGRAGREDHPINCVAWAQAKSYCAWAGKRLPTDSEWEKASRGTDGRVYPWGNLWDPGKANVDSKGTAAVGSSPSGASIYGLYDMAGNVWEWTSSVGRGHPKDPSPYENRAVYGGSWMDAPERARASSHIWYHLSRRTDHIGFRCAKTP